MAFIDASPGLNDLLPNAPVSRVDTGLVNSTSNTKNFIIESRQGQHVRQMLRWRTPTFGWVKMFLNPEHMSIMDGKDLSTTRTKAGFLLQYAGEKLTEISLSGTTGSSGIEGINILRAVYRAEQIAFDHISDELNRASIPINEILTRGARSDGTKDVGSKDLSQDALDLLLNVFLQPFPTLASLAANTELYFQGVSYRGFFKSMKVEEKADTPGIFSYSIEFTSYARTGVRRNFMPWHRQPFNPIGLGANHSNPLSFRDDRASLDLLTSNVNRIVTKAIEETVTSRRIEQFIDESFSRSTSSGSGDDGASTQDVNLEDVDPFNIQG